MDSRHGGATGRVWLLGAVALGIATGSILLSQPWRGGATAVLLTLAALLVWDLMRRQTRLIASLREAVTVDPLTGLFNRSGYEAQMEIELARAARDDSELAFIVADVDDFKAINDRLGHLGGDMALERIAGEIRGTSRAGDVAARLGGDEFAIILPRTGRRRAFVFANRLCAHIRESFSGTATDLTVSVGIALFPEAGRSAEQLLHAADQAMYEAKALGKDRVRVRTDEPRADLTPENLIGVA